MMIVFLILNFSNQNKHLRCCLLSASSFNTINAIAANIKISDTLTSLYIDATSISIGSLAIGTMGSLYNLRNYTNAASDTTLVLSGGTINANYVAGNNTIVISGNEITDNYVNTDST